MRLYHATWPSRLAAIEREGIKPGVDGVVYMANKAGYAAGFLRLRGSVEYVGVKEIEVPGYGLQQVPDIVQHDEIFVAEIETEMLNVTLLSESSDHNMASGSFPSDLTSWMYRGTVPNRAIVNWFSHPV